MKIAITDYAITDYSFPSLVIEESVLRPLGHEIASLLAPIEPRDILCIGLNYRKHAAEGNQPIPDWPVVFMKNSGTLQNPGDPIVFPRRLKSDAVD